MIVDNIEYTHCRVCDKLVKTGGTINKLTTDKKEAKNLLAHCILEHHEKLDPRIKDNRK